MIPFQLWTPSRPRGTRRRGVILVLALAMLTLFSLVGVSFAS